MELLARISKDRIGVLIGKSGETKLEIKEQVKSDKVLLGLSGGVDIKEPGVYRGQCAELCGKDHGFMPIVVKAVPKNEYYKWVSIQKSNKVAITK